MRVHEFSSYELHLSEWVHQWAESNTRTSTPLQNLAFSSIRSKCSTLFFSVLSFLSSTSNGAQQNSMDAPKSCKLSSYQYSHLKKRSESSYINIPEHGKPWSDHCTWPFSDRWGPLPGPSRQEIPIGSSLWNLRPAWFFGSASSPGISERWTSEWSSREAAISTSRSRSLVGRSSGKWQPCWGKDTRMRRREGRIHRRPIFRWISRSFSSAAPTSLRTRRNVVRDRRMGLWIAVLMNFWGRG